MVSSTPENRQKEIVEERAVRGNGALMVVGNCTLDRPMRVPRLPGIGETVLGASERPMLGGKGANQAVAAARLGVRAHLITSVGEDNWGDQFEEMFRREGVAASIERIASFPTGSAIPLALPDGENAIIVSPGAALQMTVGYVAQALSDAAPVGTILMQLQLPFDVATFVAEWAHAASSSLILNAAPVRSFGRSLIDKCPVVVVNEEEAGALLGVDAPVSTNEAVRLARELACSSDGVVFLTRGADGAVAASAEWSVSFRAYDVEAVDSTGAGDAFCAAIAVELVRGRHLEDLEQVAGVVSYASACGALATTKLGAMSGSPDRASVAEFLHDRGELRGTQW